jgi:ubiquinone biosynthesis protein UbiJ
LLKTALNRILALDPESHARLKALEGKIIRLELETTPRRIFVLEFKDQSIDLLSDIPEHSDLVIKGTPLSLLHMSLSKNKHLFLGKEIIIQGNLELGQQVIDLFEQLEIDWEEYLSRLTGDVPAHQVSRFLHRAKNFNRRVCETLLRNVNEYIHEEKDLFPPLEALQDFFSDIDELRMDIDRLEARIQQIKRNRE